MKSASSYPYAHRIRRGGCCCSTWTWSAEHCCCTSRTMSRTSALSLLGWWMRHLHNIFVRDSWQETGGRPADPTDASDPIAACPTAPSRVVLPRATLGSPRSPTARDAALAMKLLSLQEEQVREGMHEARAHGQVPNHVAREEAKEDEIVAQTLG